MDYAKAIPIANFLSHKSHSLNEIFSIKIEINDYASHWLPFDSDFEVENLIEVSDYRLVFMEDILKHYLGYVQMGVNFLHEVKFADGYLYFTTSDGKKVRLS